VGVRLPPFASSNSSSLWRGYAQLPVVRIYLLVGELEKALGQLEPLLQTHFLSPGLLKVDPTFAPLRGNPRFERLVAGK
jgi:hypothetical protein